MTRLTALTGIFVVLAIAMAASWCRTVAQTTPNQADSETLPDGPGKEVIIKKCLPCHNVRVTTAHRGAGTTDEWEKVVDKMVSQGAELSDDDIDLAVNYLTTYYGPKPKSPPAASTAAPAEPSSSAGNPDASDARPAPAPAEASGKINVNMASAEELKSALGLTQAEAEAIVRYRAQKGDFKTWQDVSSVPGVPPEKIKDNQKRLVF